MNMKKKKYGRESKTRKFIIPRERERALAPVYWNSVLQTSPLVKKHYGRTLSVEYNFFANGRANAIMLEREWNEIGEYISQRLIDDKEYFENIKEKTKNAKRKIFYFLHRAREKKLSSLSFKDLIALAEKIYILFIEYDAASVFAWLVAGEALKRKIGLSLGIYGEDFDTISMPRQRTFTTRMERDVVEAALKKSGLVGGVSRTLAKKYHWISFGYDGPTILDETHFTRRIEEQRKNIRDTETKRDRMIGWDRELRRNSEEILKKIKLSKDGERLINILRCTATWTDERKMLEYQLFFHYHQILSEFEKRYDISNAQLKYLFTDELAGLDSRSQELKKIAERRMMQEFMIISKNGRTRVATSAEQKRIKEAIGRQFQESIIHGTVACRGPEIKYTARVRVLRSLREFSRVEPGEILVTTMTTPEYVPVMDRVLGFITDEGGITCHAAIVAREMNKICIIGTKIATKVLKDGDLVEVDAEKGVVKIIKKRKMVE